MPEELEVVGVMVEYRVSDEIIELSVMFAFVSSYSNRTFPAARKLILSVIAIKEDWGRPTVRFAVASSFSKRVFSMVSLSMFLVAAT